MSTGDLPFNVLDALAADTAIDPPRPALLPVDICDLGSCAAQAWVRVGFTSGGELQFCGHHYSERELNVFAIAAYVDDFRDRINARSESSA
jgi:hypothetical protein